jgi:nucleoside-diphosphate-sugar epimerase
MGAITVDDSTIKLSKNATLITGATGFVGRHLTRELIAEGWQVHALVRSNSDLSFLSSLGNELTVHIYDGTIHSLDRIIATVKPRVVFHLASLSLVNHRAEQVAPLVLSNILLPTQLVEVMVRNGCYYLVNAGTYWQHFKSDGYHPVNLYAATKQAFEDILTYYIETSPLRAITLKLFDTYGPEDGRAKLFPLLKRLAINNEPLAMSPGHQLIDLVYIDDVVNAFIVAKNHLENMHPGAGESFSVSSGSALPLREVVHLFEEILGRSLPIQWGGRAYREREVMVPWRSGVNLPGWGTTIPIREGIKRFIHSEGLI